MDLHFFPKIEKTTFTVSTVHFLLMFGYKLFSLYYPLYLVSIGLSVVKIGWVYLLIYGTIAIAAVLTNLWLYRINPAAMASLGIFGYGVYALLMIFNTNINIFYAAQILLGVSAAFWLVSLKSIIIESKPKNYNSSFGWFYSAPEYASAFAPAVGGLMIYKFGFAGVFALSVIIQFANAIYAYFKLKDRKSPATKEAEPPIGNSASLISNYWAIYRGLKKDKIALLALLVVFSALILGGIYRAYFILFLKDLNFDQNEIIKFVSLLSIAFIPLSWLTIKFIGRLTSYQNISFGATFGGAVFAIIGLWANFLNMIYLFALLLIDAVSGLMAGSGKSGLIANKFGKFKKEASTIDTILVTLGPALGGILGGFAIAAIGFNNTFLLGGMIVFVSASAFYVFFIKERSDKRSD